MATTRELMGIGAARAALRTRVDLARNETDAVHTVLVVDLQPRGVLVSMTWRRAAATALEEPLDLAAVPIVGITSLRDRLGSYVGQHAIAAKHQEAVAALVPWDWYLRGAKALGETVDI
ncbi:hypothetical protein [Actinoplanes sp. NPDC026623]|uniref:hypothetical protein n=1 Tax=Actinoplanes sp. NPDC026623 TaxID=3155610 RepID=UPI0033C6F160